MIPEAEEKQTEPIQSEKIARGASSEVLTGIPWIWALGETLPYIEVDPILTPVINPPRTIPAALRDRGKAEPE